MNFSPTQIPRCGGSPNYECKHNDWQVDGGSACYSIAVGIVCKQEKAIGSFGWGMVVIECQLG